VHTTCTYGYVIGIKIVKFPKTAVLQFLYFVLLSNILKIKYSY